jgi:hypothetical protein
LATFADVLMFVVLPGCCFIVHCCCLLLLACCAPAGGADAERQMHWQVLLILFIRLVCTLCLSADTLITAAVCLPSRAVCCAGGDDAERQMKELIKSAQRPVAAGKVRRKKVDAGAKRATPLDKSKGFASAKTR